MTLDQPARDGILIQAEHCPMTTRHNTAWMHSEISEFQSFHQMPERAKESSGG
jgi:hypothetical protein